MNQNQSQLETILYKILSRRQQNLTTSLLDIILHEMDHYAYSLKSHTLDDIKKNNRNKNIGDIFEEFSKLYMKHVLGYTNAWLLGEFPDNLKKQFKISNQDKGIDLFVEKDGKYSAVQVKFRKRCKTRKTGLPWKQLSTFHALCPRTGPWEKYIVFTNCDYVRYEGNKSQKDLSICYQRLSRINYDDLIKMIQIKGHKATSNEQSGTKEEQSGTRTINDINTNITINQIINQDMDNLNMDEPKVAQTIEEMRQKRLERFSFLQKPQDQT